MIDQYQRAEDLDELIDNILAFFSMGGDELQKQWIYRIWSMKREIAGMDEDELVDRYGHEFADAIIAGDLNHALMIKER